MKINKIVKKINLIKLLNKLGVKNIKPLDENTMFSCPFHKDDNPSCGIKKNTGQYHCFSCGESGSLIEFIAKIKTISNKEAVQYLSNFAGISVGSLLISSKTVFRQLKKMIKLNKKQKVKKEIEYNIELPLNVNDNYYACIQYFENRGIDKYTMKKHNITFCTEGFYKNRAIIPIYKPNGSLLTFEARDITGMAEKKVLYPKNTKVNNTLFNFDKVYRHKEVIIVEGLMDALYLDQRGFNVISTYGANISETQEELLSLNFKKIYIAYDGDKAGRNATIKCGGALDLHLSVYVITLKNGTDPDSYSTSEFTRLYNKAISYQQYVSNKLLNRYSI